MDLFTERMKECTSTGEGRLVVVWKREKEEGKEDDGMCGGGKRWEESVEEEEEDGMCGGDKRWEERMKEEGKEGKNIWKRKDNKERTYGRGKKREERMEE
ncbi:hypothetical protein Pmani_030387 [Petrolisthes manimaculis]|uniref:Uncharacterized protein n=1 Tax=Petrolisthes manimaculis TaxID=1843537 RepID=A0AAE1TVZ0_9EUCA|nr:hypothetical protein Pmani_030387 [Petrolisthes manimaculis]